MAGEYARQRYDQRVEFEQIVLGTLLLEPESLTEVIEFLEPQHFADQTNGAIYGVVCGMYDRGEEVDLYTVIEQCRKEQSLSQWRKEIPTTLVGYTQLVGSGVNIVRHAQIVKEGFVAREIEQIGRRLGVLASDEGEDVQSAIDFLSTQADWVNEQMVGGNPSVSVAQAVEGSIAEVEKRVVAYSQGRATGISTGLKELDDTLFGWQNSEVTIVAARPGMGKTALALSFVKAAAKQGRSPMIYSLEMSKTQLANRFLVGESGVSAQRFRSGNLSYIELKRVEEAGERLSKLNITIDDTAGINIRQIKARSKIMHKRGLCDIIFIDYLQLAKASHVRQMGGNREQEVAEISKQCKEIAKELNIPVIALSQLNREVESRGDKKPQLSDLRESGAIEQDADIVMFIHRPSVFDIREYPVSSAGRGTTIGTNGLGVFIIAKHREGETREVLFSHNSSMTKITDWQSTPLEPDDGYWDGLSDDEPF